VSCPELLAAGCTGTVTIEVVGRMPAAGKGAVTTARRRKMMRSRRRYRVAAGKTASVPLKLDRRTARFVRRVRRARARVTITTDLAGGQHATSTSTVTLRARRTPHRH
jgi:hypothetical protein